MVGTFEFNFHVCKAYDSFAIDGINLEYVFGNGKQAANETASLRALMKARKCSTRDANSIDCYYSAITIFQRQ